MTTFTSQEFIQNNAKPNYYLNKEEFADLQGKLLDEVNDKGQAQTIYSVFLDHTNPYANLVRTLEAEIFPEIPEIMKDFEDNSIFLALVDTRPDAKRIVHAFRLSSLALTGSELDLNSENIGIALIDDLIASEQDGLNSQAFKDYYHDRGIDLSKCISVETNFRVGDKVESDNGISVPQLGYIAVFQAIDRLGITNGDAAIFAHLNKPAIVSLGAVGVEYEPIMGLKDLKTPTVGDEKFDSHYRPVAIPATPKNMAIFRDLIPFAAPEISV